MKEYYENGSYDSNHEGYIWEIEENNGTKKLTLRKVKDFPTHIKKIPIPEVYKKLRNFFEESKIKEGEIFYKSLSNEEKSEIEKYEEKISRF